jgi:transposase
MDQIKKIVEYHQKGYGKKRIARLLGMSKNTVKRYLNRIEQREIDIAELDTLKEQERMYQRDEKVVDPRDTDLENRIPLLLKELGRVGVTRFLLWEEYIAQYSEGFSYSRFCRKIRQYKNRQNATIKLEHKAAHHLTIDYTGKKIGWFDETNGLENKSEVLVCTLPYSGYTFACAVHSQKQQDFIHALNECLLYIGGLPRALLSDNLKAYVTTANNYEPKFAELCIQLSAHYGIDLQATRVGKPKDKAHVERHVAIVYNRLFAPLRDEIFYSIDEINAAFLTALEKHNSLNYQGKDYSRKDLFE